MKNKFTLTVFLLGIILTGLGAFLGYRATTAEVDKDLENLNEKINTLFQDKQVITDGQKLALEGLFDNKKRNFSLFSGGFSVYELSKESGGFVKIKWTASNLSFEKDEYEKDPTWGYSYSTYRPSVQVCYDNSFELLTKGNEKAGLKLSYTPNKYTEIKDFPAGFYSEYHFVNQTEHPSEGYLESSGTGKVYTPAWSVEYYQTKEYYTIQKNEETIKKGLIKNISIYSIIGLIFAIATAFLFKYILPSAGKSGSIFNKKWKNIDSNSILTIEPKMFGKNKVTLIENDKVKKGIAKITESGSTIQLSFIDAEYFYKLRHLSTFKLELENLASNSITKFEILGSNAYRKTEDINDIPNHNSENIQTTDQV